MSGEHPCQSYRATVGCDGWLHSGFLSKASQDESDGSGRADDAEDDDDGSASDDEMST